MLGEQEEMQSLSLKKKDILPDPLLEELRKQTQMIGQPRLLENVSAGDICWWIST